MQSRHSPGQGALISPALLVTLVGAAIAAIGVFLPWLQLEYEGQSFEFGAFEKDLGWIITGTDGVDDESGSFAHGSIILVLAGLIAVAAVMVALGQVAQRRLVPGLASGVLFVLVAGDLGLGLAGLGEDTGIGAPIGPGQKARG